MRFTGIPVYYYPTTVILVDDKIDFLTNFSLQLSQSMVYKLFSQANKALTFLKQAEDSAHVSERSVGIAAEVGGNPLTNHTLTLNLEQITDEVYNPKRFCEVAVVVVDYDMPGMDGLEFCRKLQDHPVKKILLTGKGDEKIAVKAFNEGLIDHFIQKNNKDVVELVEQNIAQLQKQYFKTMSEELRSMLARNTASFIKDPVFCDFFEKLLIENDIVEYYLTELTGSFLLLDKNARPSYLVIKCYEDLNIHYEFAADNGAPKEVLDEIRSGSKIPYAWDADDYFRLQKPEEWQSQLYPAEELHGQEIYYYALIKDLPTEAVQTNRLTSYSKFIHQLRSEE
jgi:CheY-like chemotaxis protein